MSNRNLEQAVYDTVRYFDIFDLPVTATQVWERLVVDGNYVQHTSLIEVQDVLRDSVWLTARLDTKWGYYFLIGKKDLVRERLRRHALAQDKWKIARRAARWLALVPFVRGLAGSGSFAVDNTKESSDLDFLVIARTGRIWTARLGLLIVSQLLGRRRKYWNTQAPDMLCLNHYVTDGHLAVPFDIQNMYTAMEYASLVPVYGRAVVEEFQKENASWIQQRVLSPAHTQAGHLYEVALWKWVEHVKGFFEAFLLEPIGNGVERMAEWIQRLAIARHLDLRRAGRVVVSEVELAFHPDTKVPAILQQFNKDPGQRALL